ncbi:MAG: CehA/McbA family metallohydrolase [Alicyclobacillaceae bacterium]|nr:CehA/McbA family metallohydrolase [Alicyclobacillaceae bacterium]
MSTENHVAPHFQFETTVDIHPEQEFQLLEIPMDIPRWLDSLEVTYHVVSEERASVDLGLADSHHLRGWSGGARKHVLIAINEATPGYRAGAIAPGVWKIILGAYRIPEQGCKVHLEARGTASVACWMKGDFHSHTLHSDGVYTVTEAIDLARGQKLDFLAITDHNTSTHHDELHKLDDLLLIPGMELTTYHGHANLIGRVHPDIDFRCRTRADVDAAFASAKQQGLLVSINHPHATECKGCDWSFGLEELNYDVIEVWNGPWRPSNQLTLEWWKEKLRQGEHIAVLGGSDVHGPHLYVHHGHPTTFVYTESPSIEGILDAVRKGHCFISFRSDGPKLSLNCEGSMMGDTVEGASESNQKMVSLCASNLQPGDEVRLVGAPGIVWSTTSSEDSTEVLHTFPTFGQSFLYAEVWRHFAEVDDTLLAALSNPLYFR